MKQVLTVLSCLCFSFLAFSQDILTLKNGDEIECKVIEVNPDLVFYKIYAQEDSPLFSINIDDLFSMKLESGIKQVFHDLSSPSTPKNSQKAFGEAGIPQKDCMDGAEESKAFYTGKNSGSGWVIATSILFSPLVGAIPAVACGFTPPENQNLNIPDPASFRSNVEYRNCYVKTATKTKQKKVFTSYAIGSGIWLIFFILIL